MKTTEANPSAEDNAISMTLYFGPADILDVGGGLLSARRRVIENKISHKKRKKKKSDFPSEIIKQPRTKPIFSRRSAFGRHSSLRSGQGRGAGYVRSSSSQIRSLATCASQNAALTGGGGQPNALAHSNEAGSTGSRLSHSNCGFFWRREPRNKRRHRGRGLKLHVSS